MSEDTTHNGWKNFETWVTASRFQDDEQENDAWRDRAAGLLASPTDILRRRHERYGQFANAMDDVTDAQFVAIELAEEIKDRIEEEACKLLGAAGLFTDLLNAAISEIDWLEIANYYVEAAQEALAR